MQNNVSPSDMTTGMGHNLLIPVDFSEMCEIAIKFGFEIARRLDLDPILLYASPIPLPAMYDAYPEDMGGLDNETVQIEEMEIGLEMYHSGERRMDALKRKLDSWQKAGTLIDRPYKTVVSEGMPEEVIREYARFQNPEVIVMATRGIRKKEEELVGSVTAEVLDNCRVPLFAIPENYSICDPKDIIRLAAVCNLEGQDVACVDELMKMFGNPKVSIWLVPMSEKRDASKAKLEINAIESELRQKYPSSDFYKVELPENGKREALENFMRENDIQMIIVPNKKKNIFARIFNPGIAHRILFEKDIPLLALPV